ncbi:hypothetical protein JQ599_09645 [Bradyrhizobium diazoefficiens]|nr:hypothetical protein [Bradyrhizobium diazoefficiens]MBR0700162.1 hypothetical protein [Bradyrhizobium diazoefficiens]MBR0768497.1 hypothetical protein [Bradyrhizobium diazoefficiens]
MTGRRFPIVGIERRAGEDIPYKDIVVIAPLCGSLLAVAWEVGSFEPIGNSAFGSFSLAEHLAFALPALPLAMMGFLMPMAMATIGTLGRLKRSVMARGKNGRIVAAVFALGLSIASFLGLVTAIYTVAKLPDFPWLFAIATSLSGPAIVVVVLVDPTKKSERIRSLLWTVLYATFLAYAFGQTQTSKLFRSGTPSDIEVDGAKLKLIVFRASATTLIGIEPGTKHILLLKGDRIKERRWDAR